MGNNYCRTANLDICEADLHDCHKNAECVKEEFFAYSCKCRDGYVCNSCIVCIICMYSYCITLMFLCDYSAVCFCNVCCMCCMLFPASFRTFSRLYVLHLELSHIFLACQAQPLMHLYVFNVILCINQRIACNPQLIFHCIIRI